MLIFSTKIGLTVLTFLVLVIACFQASGQNKNFSLKLDTCYSVNVDSININARSLSYAGISDSLLLFTVPSANNFELIQLNPTNSQIKAKTIDLDSCFSSDYTIRYISGYNNQLALLAKNIAIHNQNTSETFCLDYPKSTQVQVSDSGILILNNYTSPSTQLSHESIILWKDPETIIELHYPSHHSQLNSFSPNHLIEMRGKHIVRASVSKPIVYLYDTNLDLDDSLVLQNMNWKDADDLVTKKKLKQSRKKGQDFFSFYIEMFGEGLCKNSKITFVNDSLLMLSSMLGDSKFCIQFIEIVDNKLRQVSDLLYPGKCDCSVNDKLQYLDKEQFFPKFLGMNGLVLNKKLYYFRFGSETIYWNMTCKEYFDILNNPSKSNGAWLQIFQFSVLQH